MHTISQQFARWLNVALILALLSNLLLPISLASASPIENSPIVKPDDTHLVSGPGVEVEQTTAPMIGRGSNEANTLPTQTFSLPFSFNPEALPTSPALRPALSNRKDEAEATQVDLPASPTAEPFTSPIQAVQASSQSGLMFIENVGQFDPKVRFMVHGGMSNLYLTDNALWFTVLERTETQSRTQKLKEARGGQLDLQSLHLKPKRGVNLKLSFAEANPQARLEPFDRLDTHVSFFIGDDPAQWQTNVPVWGGVRYVDFYPGVDLEVLGSDGQWTWRAVERVEGALAKVRLEVAGAQAVAKVDGRLRADTAVGRVALPALEMVGVEEQGSVRDSGPGVKTQVVNASFAGTTPAVIPAAAGAALPSAQTPPRADVLYGTYLGFNFWDDSDSQGGITLDSAGNVYVVMRTYDGGAPTTPGAYDLGGDAAGDIYIAKLRLDGNGDQDLLYATYLGGNGTEWDAGIAVDSTGDIYVTGNTNSSNFPVVNPYQSTLGGYNDAFVVRLHPAGNGSSDLLYSTYLGKASYDQGFDLAVKENTQGQAIIYVFGMTNNADFPTTLNAYDRTHKGSSTGFVATLNPALSGQAQITYSTFLGIVGYDSTAAGEIAVDTAGDIYVAGQAESDFSITGGAVDTTLTGYSDAFLVKLRPAGTGSADLLYGTYLGGSGADMAYSLAIDAAGNAYLGGQTESVDFPPTIGAFDTTLGGLEDGFVAKIRPDSSMTGNLLYSTYLGGDGDGSLGGGVEYVSGIGVDAGGKIYITGYTDYGTFPTTSDASQPTIDPVMSYDGFLTKLDPTVSGAGGLVYSSYLGGTGKDYFFDLAVDATGNAYVVGGTWGSTDLPTTGGAYDTTYNGSGSGYVVKLRLGSSTPCPPLAYLSDIGQAMASVVPPASNCSSTFEKLILTSSPGAADPEGTQAFEEFATLARNAKYEILFTSMDWTGAFNSDAENQGLPGHTPNKRYPGDILLDAIEFKYRDFISNTTTYPHGMTIRILTGGTPSSRFDKKILEELAARNIDPMDSATGWRIEVADYPKNHWNTWSHVKVMIVDGETVIATGYNMDNFYFLGPDSWLDMGVKFSGAIALEAVEMFDNLWQGAIVCVYYAIPQGYCKDTEVAPEDPDHAPGVLDPKAGTGQNAFSLFRSSQDPTANDAIMAAMSSSNQSLKLMQAYVAWWNLFSSKPPHFVDGMLQAIENGSIVRYIFDGKIRLEKGSDLVNYTGGLTNLISYWKIRNLAESRGLDLTKLEVRGTRSRMHTKALSIDGQMFINGSLNFDFSSWGGGLLNLAEYDIAVDGTNAVTEYDQYFETMWNDSLLTTRIFIASSTNPNLSIQNLVDQAMPYSTILLPPGIYRESVHIDKPLQIVGISGSDTIIEPPNGQPAFEATSSGVIIYNLTIRGGTSYGVKLIDVSSNSLKDIVIRKVIFENNVLGGILVEGLIPGSPINYTLENNSFIGGQSGVRLNLLEQQTVTSTIRNNLFFDQSAVPIKIDGITDGKVDYGYNLFNNCARSDGEECPTDWYSGNLSSASNVHDNLLNLDPGFSDPIAGDYTLLSNSSAIDAGDPTTVNEIGWDGLTAKRADIGAFEAELALEIPMTHFQEVDGQVVMEAEHFTWSLGRGSHPWLTQVDLTGSTGPGYLNALPDTDLRFETPYTTTNPELQYTVNFTTTGVYTVWLRGYAPNAAGDSLYLALDDQPIITLTGFAPRAWTWTNQRVNDLVSGANAVTTLEITEPGLHTLRLWQREDGLRLDRIVLTTNSSYNPTGNGPTESNRVNDY